MPEEEPRPTRPRALRHLLAPVAPLLARRVWCHALVLVAGTLLAPGKRTVCAARRARGLRQTPHWTRDHRVFNRARWSRLAVSRVLLGLLVATFAPTGPRVVGLGETRERRHPQAGTRAAARRAGARPRRAAAQSGALRQRARAARAVLAARGAAPLGRAGGGRPLAHHPRPRRAA